MITGPAPAPPSSLGDQLSAVARVTYLPALFRKLFADPVGALEIPVGASGLTLVGQPPHGVRRLLDRLLEQVLEPQGVEHLAQSAVAEPLAPVHPAVPLGDPVEEGGAGRRRVEVVRQLVEEALDVAVKAVRLGRILV